MAVEVLKQRLGALSNSSDAADLRIALEALIDGIRAVLAIYDADAGVTATNAVATFDAIIVK